MNLLPVPRTLELTKEVVSGAPPRRRLDRSLPAQGYELRIDRSGVELAGGDEAGLFYGEATLAQLARLHAGALPVGLVRDHPDLPVRGVMLDVSRDKVPTMATVRAIVERLASLEDQPAAAVLGAHVRLSRPRRGPRSREPVRRAGDPGARRILP